MQLRESKKYFKDKKKTSSKKKYVRLTRMPAKEKMYRTISRSITLSSDAVYSDSQETPFLWEGSYLSAGDTVSIFLAQPMKWFSF